MNHAAWLSRLAVRSGVARLLPGLSGPADYRSERLAAAPLAQLERLAAAQADAPPDVLDLSAGCPRFDLLPSATTRLPADRRGPPCPAGLPELREAVAARLLADGRLAVCAADEVLVTAGATGAVGVVLDAFVDRGDAVVLTDPSSPLFSLLARSRGARVRWVPAACEAGRLRLDFDALGRRLRGARLAVLDSPHNPTGGVAEPEDLERFAWLCRRHDVLMLADESFSRYRPQRPGLATMPHARERTLTVGGVSKGHGLASMRVGWLAGDARLVRACAATAALRSSPPATLCQQLAAAALTTTDAAFAPVAEAFERRRRFARERLEAAGLRPDVPGGGFFLWLRVPEGAAFCESLAAERKVRLVPGDLFGPSGRRRARLGVAADDGRLDEALGRIAEHVKGGSRPGQGA